MGNRKANMASIVRKISEIGFCHGGVNIALLALFERFDITIPKPIAIVNFHCVTTSKSTIAPNNQ